MRSARALLLGLALSLAGFAGAQPPHYTIAPEAASGFGPLQTATARRYLAVTANPHATEAARAMLQRGGSAVDAAIAAQLVLGLVEPQSSGIGGGAFLLFWDQGERRLRYYDGRETAPKAVDERLFLDPKGQPQPFFDAVIGGASVGVPGAVKLMALTHRRHGKLPWAELFQPAIALAEQGFPISPRLYTLLEQMPRLAVNPAITRYFFLPDGKPKPVGTLLRNPDYGETLRLLAQEGEAAFYQGPIARDIVATVRDNPNRAGKLALTDLAEYRALERAPLCGYYRVYRVCGAAPPSAGGSTVLAILGVLQRFSPTKLDPADAGFYHLFAEASRLAFADRDTYLADPDFVEVPAAGLVDPVYLARRADLIDPAKAMATAVPGKPAWPKAAAARLQARSPELMSTSHLSIVDADGNAVSMTTSIETAFGSRLLVRGFLLNNQLTDFSFVPRGADGALIANRIQPGKRPRSSMAPVIVFRESRPVLVLGSPGGSRIVDYVAKTLVLTLDGRMTMAEAIASPHIIAMGQGVELERGRVAPPLRKRLEALGHRISETPQASGLGGIWLGRGELRGSADPRREGTAAGE